MSPDTATIRQLVETDAEAYFALRRASLIDSPLAFVSSPADDFASSIEVLREHLRRAPESVIIGAFGPELVGSVSMYRDPHLKASHKAHLVAMYVAPGARRRGLGATLLDAVLAHARTLSGVSWVHLSVSSAAPEAHRLYQRAGFRLWGTEPDSLRHDGVSVVEHHMALELGVDVR